MSITVCMEVQNTFDNAGPWKTYSTQFLTSFNTKHLALNYAQAFENRMKESLKKNYEFKKSNCPMSNTFMPLLALSTMSLPSVQTMTKEDEFGMGADWIGNFRPVWQPPTRSKSTQDKAGSLPPASRDYSYVMLFAIFLKSLNVFCINWIPKIMVQFCYLTLYLGIDILSRRLLQWIARIENGLKLRPTKRYRTHTVISTR